MNQASRDFATMITESRNQRTSRIDAGTSLEILDLIQEEDLNAFRAVRKVRHQIAQAVELVSAAIRSGGRLYYVGAGTSGRLGVLDAAECPPTFGTPPELVQGIIAGGRKALVRAIEGAEDRPESGATAIRKRRIRDTDIVFGITASGSTPFVLGALVEAKRRGATTILLSFNPVRSSAFVDLLINPVVGPEVVTGSTRMKAGTATKLILNAITTATMVRLGKVYGNLMVDLRATNEKLRDRTQRIVMEMTKLDKVATVRLLRRAGGDAKTAIVVHYRRVSRSKARTLLEAHGGILRRVIGDV